MPIARSALRSHRKALPQLSGARRAQVLRLWEALWTQHPAPQLHIFCAAALLERHRRAIMERNLDFDGLLKCALNP